MGLRCLIGHEYGEPQTSRDRREGGNEVVTTVREYRECARCGHRRIISENTEVTAEQPGAADEPAAEAAWAPDAADADAAAGTFPVSDADLGRGSDAPAADDEPMSAAADDGIILEDEPAVPPRGHGEWPEADVGESTEGDVGEPEPWPDEESPADPATPSRGEEAEGVDPDAAAEDESARTVDHEAPSEPAARAGATPPTPTPPPDPGSTELVCPDCAETWPAVNASLRPGDICPECRRGYLDERVVQ